jgi:hypothetical protein
VNPAPHEGLPDPFDLRNRDTGSPEEIGERVEPLAADATATKPAAQRRKDDPVLGIDGIQTGGNPDDVQESGNLASHRRRSSDRSGPGHDDFEHPAHAGLDEAPGLGVGAHRLSRPAPTARVPYLFHQVRHPAEGRQQIISLGPQPVVVLVDARDDRLELV